MPKMATRAETVRNRQDVVSTPNKAHNTAQRSYGIRLLFVPVDITFNLNRIVLGKGSQHVGCG